MMAVGSAYGSKTFTIGECPCKRCACFSIPATAKPCCDCSVEGWTQFRARKSKPKPKIKAKFSFLGD